MPKSVASYYSLAASRDGIEDDDEEAEYIATSRDSQTPTTPTARRHGSSRTSEIDLRSRLPSRYPIDENTSLLAAADTTPSYSLSRPATAPTSPRMRFSRQQSHTNSGRRNHSRHESLGLKLNRAFGTDRTTAEGKLFARYFSYP